MAEVKFLIVLPTNPDPDRDGMTKFAIRGALLPQPEQFSINFVNSTSCTDNITYHFKIMVPTQTLIENYKADGEWSGEHQEKYLNIFDGNDDTKMTTTPSITNGFESALNYSFTESTFSLEFQFDYTNSLINVYQVRGHGHNFVTKFETLFSLSAIKSVQVWGDVQKVNAFSMNYD
ncbi:hypothetical protein KR222_010519 [Zaprionus bogoriensis]|nr:hypothetical protein KR222_010519 [Zaprionus bogoriensis]